MKAIGPLDPPLDCSDGPAFFLSYARCQDERDIDEFDSLYGLLLAVLLDEVASELSRSLDTHPDELGRDALRLLSGNRSALRMALPRVRTALADRPDDNSFLRVLKAVCRHDGRCGQLDEYVPLVRTPISVVRGELVLAC